MTPAGVWSVVSATRDTWHRVTALLHLTPGCDTISAVVRHLASHSVTPSHWHWSALSNTSAWQYAVGTRGISASLCTVCEFEWPGIGYLELNFTELSKVCLRGGYRGCGGGDVLIVGAVRRSLAQWNIFIASIRSVLHRSAFSAALVLVFVIMFSLLRTPGRGSRGTSLRIN